MQELCARDKLRVMLRIHSGRGVRDFQPQPAISRITKSLLINTAKASFASTVYLPKKAMAEITPILQTYSVLAIALAAGSHLDSQLLI